MRCFGVEIHRAGSMRHSIGEECGHLARLGVYPRTTIDVGAAEGTPGLYQYFPEAALLLIEPLAEYEAALRRTCRDRGNASFRLAAGGRQVGTVEINVSTEDPTGSACLVDPRSNRTVRTVPLTTLDVECEARSLRGPYLLKLDLQGYELEVLRGARQVLRDTHVAILEVSFFRFFTTNPIFSGVVAFMSERGFELYDILGASVRPYDRALAQADVVFADRVVRSAERFA
jgi:FkbM family methyltransferase